MRFEHRTVLITGGSKGIGRATAIRFAEEGAHVTILDPDSEHGERTQAHIKGEGGVCRYVNGDCSDDATVKAVVEGIAAEWGRMDVVVNNAYWHHNLACLELPEEKWDRTIAVTLKGGYLTARHALPHMIRQGGGSIVNIASVHGLASSNRFLAYDAAKAGVIGLTRQLAVEYGRHHVRVNAICPGWVINEWQSYPEEHVKTSTMAYPLKRAGRPDDIAWGVLFLASDQAGFITGHALTIDGGLTACLNEWVIQEQALAAEAEGEQG